tara:strand:- start:338 stop:520 length:183 start_codon:yes stop_codon:yes gene_type:complete
MTEMFHMDLIRMLEESSSLLKKKIIQVYFSFHALEPGRVNPRKFPKRDSNVSQRYRILCH